MVHDLVSLSITTEGILILTMCPQTLIISYQSKQSLRDAYKFVDAITNYKKYQNVNEFKTKKFTHIVAKQKAFYYIYQ